MHTLNVLKRPKTMIMLHLFAVVALVLTLPSTVSAMPAENNMVRVNGDLLSTGDSEPGTTSKSLLDELITDNDDEGGNDHEAGSGQEADETETTSSSEEVTVEGEGDVTAHEQSSLDSTGNTQPVGENSIQTLNTSSQDTLLSGDEQTTESDPKNDDDASDKEPSGQSDPATNGNAVDPAGEESQGQEANVIESSAVDDSLEQVGESTKSQANPTEEPEPDAEEFTGENAEAEGKNETVDASTLIPPMPDEVGLLVLDGEGQPLPLASMQAAEILSVPDPYFTRGGTVVRFAADCTGLSNCTVSATPIQAAIADVKANGMPDDLTINVEAGTYNENVEINSFAAVQPLILLGGIGGGTSTISGTLYIHDNVAAIEVNGFTITGGVSGNDNGGGVALKYLTITGNANSLGNGAAGAAFTDSTSFLLENVTASNIPLVGGSGYGVVITNSNGTVEVRNSTFDNNPDIGLLISDHTGTITITNVAASNNDGAGAYLHNPTSGNVDVSDSTFDGNGAGGGVYLDGLDVITSGDITMTDVSANNNAGYGAYLDNCGWNGATCTGAGTGDVSVDPSTFSDNGSDGLVVYSADDIVVDQVTAGNNGDSRVWLQTKNGAGAIIITNSIFQGSPVAINCTTAEHITVTAGGVLVPLNCTTSGGGGGGSSQSNSGEGGDSGGIPANAANTTSRQNAKLFGSTTASQLASLVKTQILASTLEDRVAWGMLEAILKSVLTELSPGNILSNDPLGGVGDGGGIFANDPLGAPSSGGRLSALKSEIEAQTGFAGLQRGSRSGAGQPSSGIGRNLGDILLAHGRGRYYSGGSSQPDGSIIYYDYDHPVTTYERYKNDVIMAVGSAWITLKNWLPQGEEEKKNNAANGVRGDCPADADVDCGGGTGGGSGQRVDVFDLPIRRPLVDNSSQCPDDRPKCAPEGALQGIMGGGGSDDDPEARCDQDKRYCLPSGILGSSGGDSGPCEAWECGGKTASTAAEPAKAQKAVAQSTSRLSERVKKNLQSAFVGGALLAVGSQSSQ